MDTEEDVFWSNSTTSEIDHDEELSDRIYIELFSVVCILSLLANILTIFVILKFKKLRKDLNNILILHLSIIQAIFAFFTPIILRALTDFGLITRVPRVLLCVYHEVQHVTLLAMLLFLILLLFEWYIKKYCENAYVKFLKIYCYLIAIIYILMFMLVLLSTQFCFKRASLSITLKIVVVGFILAALTIFIVNIMHRIKVWRGQGNKNPNIGLMIVNIFVLSWCPTVIATVFMIYGFHSPILLVVFSTLGFSSPIANVIYLFVYENNFNCFIKKVIKCEYNDYTNDSLVEDQSVSYTVVNGVQISNQ